MHAAKDACVIIGASNRIVISNFKIWPLQRNDNPYPIDTLPLSGETVMKTNHFEKYLLKIQLQAKIHHQNLNDCLLVT